MGDLHTLIKRGVEVSELRAYLDANPTVTVNTSNEEGDTPLHTACKCGHLDVINMLLGSGADLRARNHADQTTYHHAAYSGNIESVLTLCLAEPAIINSPDVSENSDPIMQKFRRGELREVDFEDEDVIRVIGSALTKATVDALSSRDAYGRLPIEYAVVEDAFTPQLVAFLLQADFPLVDKLPEGVIKDRADSLSWSVFVEMVARYELHEGKYAKLKTVFSAVLSKWQSNVYDLAHFRDVAGREAMQLANEDCKEEFFKYLYFCERYELDDAPPLDRGNVHSVIFAATDYGVTKEYIRLYEQKVQESNSHGGSEGGIPGMISSQSSQGFITAHSAQSLLRNISRNRIGSFHGDSLAFQYWDRNNDGVLSKSEFLRLCRGTFGGTRRVAIKFFKEKSKWKKERTSRQLSNGEAMDERFILMPRDDVTDRCIQKSLRTFRFKHAKLSDYNHCLVMPCAERCLRDIRNFEVLTLDEKRIILREVAAALEYLHDKNVIHANVKMQNVLRIRDHHGTRYCLTDLENSVTIAPHLSLEKLTEGDATKCLNFRWFCGTMPPECFASLDTEKQRQDFSTYWADFREENPVEWVGLQPIETPQGLITTRCFRKENVGDVAPKIYTLVTATTSIDVWSFGVMMYDLCAEETLFVLNNRENIRGPGAVKTMQQLYDWQDHRFVKVCGSLMRYQTDKYNDDIGYKVLYDLICRMLRRKPARRIQSMKQILKHPFFQVSNRNDNNSALIEDVQKILKCAQKTENSFVRLEQMTAKVAAQTKRIERVSDRILVQMRKSQEVLLRAIIEAADVTAPTSFIILPYKKQFRKDPTELTSSASSSQKKEAEKKRDWLKVHLHLAMNLTDCAHKFISKAVDVKEGVENAAETFTSILAGDDKVITDTIAKGFDRYMEGRTESLYLYLIDEASGEVVEPPANSCNYPILITHPKKDLPYLLPLAHIGLKSMLMINNIAKLADAFNVPTLTLGDNYVQMATSLRDSLSKESSVVEFNMLHRHVKKVISAKDDKVSTPKMSARGEHMGGDDTGNSNRNSNHLGSNDGGGGLDNEVDDDDDDDDDGEKACASPDTMQVRGALFRQFERFLCEHDPNSTFCDLQRVITPQGESIWTTAENAKRIENGEDLSMTEIESKKPQEDTLRPQSASILGKVPSSNGRNDGDNLMKMLEKEKEARRTAQQEVEKLRQKLQKASEEQVSPSVASQSTYVSAIEKIQSEVTRKVTSIDPVASPALLTVDTMISLPLGDQSSSGEQAKSLEENASTFENALLHNFLAVSQLQQITLMSKQLSHSTALIADAVESQSKALESQGSKIEELAKRNETKSLYDQCESASIDQKNNLLRAKSRGQQPPYLQIHTKCCTMM